MFVLVVAGLDVITVSDAAGDDSTTFETDVDIISDAVGGFIIWY